jgi:hypothetical protein
MNLSRRNIFFPHILLLLLLVGWSGEWKKRENGHTPDRTSVRNERPDTVDDA